MFFIYRMPQWPPILHWKCKQHIPVFVCLFGSSCFACFIFFVILCLFVVVVVFFYFHMLIFAVLIIRNLVPLVWSPYRNKALSRVQCTHRRSESPACCGERASSEVRGYHHTLSTKTAFLKRQF